MEAGDQRGAQWRIVDVGGSRFQVRMLAYSGYSVNNAADSVAVAAYVVAISSSGCSTFLHVTLLSMWRGVATWVPFFDNGKWLTKG
jgi:hypothetical protein